MLPALRSWVPWVVALPVCVGGLCVGWTPGSAAQTLSVRHPEPPAAPAPPPAEPAAVHLDPEADSAPPPGPPAPVETPAPDVPQPAPTPPVPPTSPPPESRPATASPAPSLPASAAAAPAPDKRAAPTGSQPSQPQPSQPQPTQSQPSQSQATQPQPSDAQADKPQVTQPQPAKPPQPKAAEVKPGRPADTLKLQKFKLAALIDRVVIGKEKVQIGHVIDVLVDEKGEPAALVVDVGGFLGVGNRRIAIAWERFELAGRNFRDPLQLPLTDAQVKSAPAYDGSEEVTVIQGAIEAPAAGSSSSRSPDAGKAVASGASAPPATEKSSAPPAVAPQPARSDVEDPAVSRVDVGHQIEISAGSDRRPEAAPPLHPAPGSFVPAGGASTTSEKSALPPAPVPLPAPAPPLLQSASPPAPRQPH